MLKKQVLTESGYRIRWDYLIRWIITLVKSVVEEIGIDVQVHAHNDLGLAMANVLAGVQAGAKYIQATINGWGERVGLVGLEVVVIALKRILGIETGINHTKFPEVCSLVASLFNRSIPPWQPI